MKPGERLGPYRIDSLIGVGGMGEVYRAHDTTLQRDVAIKMLPAALATDADRLARLTREAQVLASLNHPHIAQIYGFERAGDTHALVMELVDGDDLSRRLASGPIPIDEALTIARQITDALEAAHEQGIIHRDLKPANIKVRTDGTVKVLDFGLAKIADDRNGGESSVRTSASQSPTITTPAMTSVGTILGTAAYMSPEQAKGKPADKRSDIWAFGVVLYEMLTGHRAFDGEDVSETLAAVLRGEPAWDLIPAATPQPLVAGLRRCLRRQPRERITDLSTVRFALDDLTSATTPIAPAKVDRRRLPVVVGLASAAAGALLTIAVGTNWPGSTQARPAPPITTFALPLDPSIPLTTAGRHVLALSPDGTRLVYAAGGQLLVRSMSDMQARPLAGTDQAADAPFFSPDGRWLGFYSATERKLKKVPLAGGPAVPLCDTVGVNGAAWASDDQVYFVQGVSGGVMRVAASGGVPQVVVARENSEILYLSQVLPDAHTLLLTISEGRTAAAWDRARIVAHSLTSGERTLLGNGSDARYSPTGHLLYTLGSTVHAVRFDLSSLKVNGGPVPIVDDVRRAPPGTTAATQYALSDDGTLALVPGNTTTGSVTPTLVDRSGNRASLPLPAGAHTNPRISPDGKRLVLATDDARGGIVSVVDLTGATAVRRLTFQGSNSRPMWTPDGERITLRSDRDGLPGAVFEQPADGSGTAQPLFAPAPNTSLQPEAWTPDGSALLASTGAAGGGDRSLVILRRGAAEAASLVPRYASNSTLSPDGKWFAYYAQAPDSSTSINIEPFPPTGAKYELPDSEVRDPLWSRDGKELFYARRNGASWRLMSLAVFTGAGVTFGAPQPLKVEGFVLIGPRGYDVTPDGKRVVVLLPAPSTEREQIKMTLNWFEDLRRQVQ